MHKFKKINLFFFIFLLVSKNSFSLNNKNVNSNCFLIDKVDLTGNTLLDDRQKSKVISPYLQQCLTLNDMQEVAKSITNNYIKKGYVTSQAIIPEQDLSNHKLVIKIIEGRIKDISINGISSRLVDIIFPSSKGKILNLRDLEHGLAKSVVNPLPQEKRERKQTQSQNTTSHRSRTCSQCPCRFPAQVILRNC